ncbi:hypothetical protein BH11PSE12_BH11PSE12_18560 [soil metagenome]
MSADFSGAQVVFWVLNALTLILVFFVRIWMNRLQSDLDSQKKAHAELVAEFHAYQLVSAREFASRSEMSHGRAEVMEAMHKIEAKVDRIFDKLDKKADK